jgi:hypothetical protein
MPRPENDQRMGVYAMDSPALATYHGKGAMNPGRDDDAAVIEIPLLLPANRAEALVALSRTRRESIGQILRQMIDNALALAEDG